MPMESPKDEYLRRLQFLTAQEAKEKARDRTFITAKIAVAFLTIFIAGWLAKYHSSKIAWTLVPLGVLVLLFVLHEKVLQSIRRISRLKTLYQQGIDRLESRWMDFEQQGERFLDPIHPYARDLDIFGRGSLFQLLSTARTHAGENQLAAWLLQRSSIEEIKERQIASAEMSTKLDLRERIALAGDDVRVGVHPEALIAWSESTKSFAFHSVLRFLLPILASMWAMSVAAWFLFDWTRTALFMSLLNMAVTYWLYQRTTEAIAGIEFASHDLNLLSSILKEIEDAEFTAPLLKRLQAALNCDGICPSRAIEQLNKKVTWLDAYENWVVKVLNLFVFWAPLWVLAVEAWRDHYGAKVVAWISIVGEIEALASLGNYSYEHPEDIFPDFVKTGAYLKAKQLAHPLLPRSGAVANDITLDSSLQMIVISGPNMAGKSTFIRSVGMNVVLAQAGAPVCASQLTLSSLNVAASICILDSLQGGLSRFYAEITRLKTIDSLSKEPTHVLFLLDELLSGTNSHDRRVGTESFIRSLLARGTVGLVTTHDLALTEIVDTLDGHAANFHFADTFTDGKLHFDYKLVPGIVQTANALQLMRSIGLDV